MGFFVKLRIILWKNLTLKIRSPFVLAFEVFIPLVLFVILLMIRHKQMPEPRNPSHFSAQPLPSAGVLPIMQVFCNQYGRDQSGFPKYRNSSLYEFLENLQKMGEEHNFFEPTFTPADLDRLPELYREIIEDPASVHDVFMRSQDIRVESVFVNQSELAGILERNFSLSQHQVDVLYNSKVNLSAVYELLFESDQYRSNQEGDYSTDENYENILYQPDLPIVRTKRDAGADRDAWRNLEKEGRERLNLQNGEKKNISTVIAENIRDNLGNITIPNSNITVPNARGFNINQTKTVYNQLVDQIQGMNTDENNNHLLDDIFDSSGQTPFFPAPSGGGLIYRIIASDPELLTDPEVRDVILRITGFDGDSTVDTGEMLDVMRKVLLSPSGLHYITCSSDALPVILVPPEANDTQTLEDIQTTVCNMSMDRWKALSDVLMEYSSTEAVLAQLHLENTNITVAGEHAMEFTENLKLFIMFEEGISRLSRLASNLPQNSCHNHATGVGNFTGNGTLDGGFDWLNETDPEATSKGPPRDDHKHHNKQEEAGKEGAKKRLKYSGLLQVWMAMQQTLCGESIVTQEHINNFSKSGDVADLGFSRHEMQEIGILVHVLYSNPRILYAPNTTEADKVIQKANGTFVLIDSISGYAREWLNVSAQLRDYLNQEKTRRDLLAIRQMQMSLQSLPALSALLDDPAVLQFVENTTVFDAPYLLHQLTVIDNAACSWLSIVDGLSMNVFQGFRSEEEVVNYFLKDAYHDEVTVFASVIFSNMEPDGSLPANVEYKIRQNSSFTPKTSMVRDRFWFPGPSSSMANYYQFGFTWVQDIIERAIVNVQVGQDITEPGAWIHEMPYPCYVRDKFLFMIEHVMPLTLTVSWVYTVAMLVQGIVYEKEQRLKEVMRMMGLSNTVHWLAWVITTFTQMSVTSLIIALMFKFGHILAHSNFWVIFLTLEVYVIATICFSFLISACYSKAKLAAACAGIIYFISYVPYMYVAIREEAAQDHIPAWAKTIASLFSTTAFGMGCKYFAFYEIEGVGVQWENLARSPVEDDQYNLLCVLLMMLFDAALYAGLTWYIENVHPGSYGLPKPWYFPFTYNYWCNRPIRTENQQSSFCDWLRGRRGHLSVMEDDQACALVGREELSSFEREPGHLPIGVSVENLTKQYKNGKLAVNRLSLNLYEGQITSFLGHNGAGKTTTMSILTGLFPPSAGYATIYRLDIRTSMDEIRRSLGMCPQHNVLFDKLTVEEHLWFYSRLKGRQDSEIKKETDQMIADMHLTKKRHARVDCLSGGMQRKLSVAIAFVAGSRTVILDEPTAGVDPYARRQIWDLLLKYKNGRTILLSTHHMDEADVLGDRIAIISAGKLRCCGSSLFLKSHYGEGYHLIVVKRPAEEDLVSRDTLELEGEWAGPSFRTACRAQKVTQFILRHVATAYLKSESSQELHYILPFHEAKKGNFEKLFQALDSSLADLEVASYGVVDTSLEEVFLKVTEQASKDEDDNAKNSEKEGLKQMQGHLSSANEQIVPELDNYPSMHPNNLPHGDQTHTMNELSPRDLNGTSNEFDSPTNTPPSTNAVEMGILPPHPTPQYNGHSNTGNTGQGACALPPIPPGQHKTGKGRFIRGHRRSTSAGCHGHATRRISAHSMHARDDSAQTGNGGDQLTGSTGNVAAAANAPARGGQINRAHMRSPSDMSVKQLREFAAEHARHVRYPSDMSVKQLRQLAAAGGSNAPPQSHVPHHRRTPSDISLRTLASIRGSYATHRRTGSEISNNFRLGHYRSVSDARVPLLPPPSGGQATHRHQRLPSDSSELLDAGSDLVPNFGTYARLENQDDVSLLMADGSTERTPPPQNLRVQGCLLLYQQFVAILVKRFFFIRRNWKQLFTQILLPALFVCIAMTVALTAPQAKDLPAMTLDPAQYYNYTQPQGDHVPYTDYEQSEGAPDHDCAGAQELIGTFHLPSGLGATCLLNTPYNSSFDFGLISQFNHTRKTYELLEAYFRPRCRDVFVHGMKLSNFVPRVESLDEDEEGVEVSTMADNGTGMNPGSGSGPTTPRYYPLCRCAPDQTGFVCPEGGYVNPPHFQAVTSDILQDITGNLEEDFYLHTTDLYRLHRYGGFAFGVAKKDVPSEYGRNGPTEFKKLAVRNIAKVRYNQKGYHSMPTFLNTLNNAILRANLPSEKGNPAAYGITLINHPMNNTNNELSLDKLEQGSDVLIAIFVIVAMSFVPASFVVFLVYERSIKAKHLQFVSGMNRVVYWTANYTWDMFNYMIPALCCILILKGFNIPAYVSSTNFPAVVSLFLLYGWSITPMMYPSSFVFDEPSAAYISMIVANLFIGITCIITSFLLELFQMNDPDLKSIHDMLKNVFLLFPNYCLGRGLMDIAFNEYRNQYYYKAGLYDKMQNPFAWEIMLRNLVAMATMGLVFFIITVLIEYNFFCKARRVEVPANSHYALDEDPDVSTERRRVLRGAGKRDLLRLENLTKVYVTRKLGRHLAVDRLCLGVPQGECFGLLGVNGAGKTTTFKMLTGELEPSAGEAFLDGHSILRDLGHVQENIGYCPQFDALYDTLTAREHLQLYARLRGIPLKHQHKVVEWVLEKLALSQYADRQSGSYSGGNKRKLSTAIALIGQPPVIFLDEPTTGMDPHSRRFLWDLILDLIQGGKSVILTSHSMEECEALCTRLAIMVNSRFKCLGSIQHLKTKFGEGYTISVRVKGPQYDREVFAVKRFIESHFPQASLKECHHNVVEYELSSQVPLAAMFSKMEEAQRELNVEDYSISQNTLDNVFINFVKQQQEIVSEGVASVNQSEPRDDAELRPFVTASPDLDLDVMDDDIATFEVPPGSSTCLQLMDNTEC